MKDYSEFFKSVVAEHLHKLVDIVGDFPSQRILVHEWVLGIESTWRDFKQTLRVYPDKQSTNDSDFIARLSFWIGGLRDKFNSNPSKIQVIELLYQTFDASTFCYFDYGARDDVEAQIEKYCKQVDNWFNEEILKPKLKRFRLSKHVIPLVNKNIDIIKNYGIDLDHSTLISIDKDVRDASGLEKEFITIFKKISDSFVKCMIKNVNKIQEINSELNSFINECNKLGYKGILSNKQNSEIQEIKNIINKKNNLKEILVKSFSNLQEYYPELSEPADDSHFTNIFDDELKTIDVNKALQHTYSIHEDVLKRNPTSGNEIIEMTKAFIKSASKEFDVEYLEDEFKKIKDKSYLKVKVVNIFKMAKKDIKVLIKKNNKILFNKYTDEFGEVIFDNLPKEELTISILKKDEEKEYPITIDNYYNEKRIWLLAF